MSKDRRYFVCFYVCFVGFFSFVSCSCVQLFYITVLCTNTVKSMYLQASSQIGLKRKRRGRYYPYNCWC